MIFSSFSVATRSVVMFVAFAIDGRVIDGPDGMLDTVLGVVSTDVLGVPDFVPTAVVVGGCGCCCCCCGLEFPFDKLLVALPADPDVPIGGIGMEPVLGLGGS